MMSSFIYCKIQRSLNHFVSAHFTLCTCVSGQCILFGAGIWWCFCAGADRDVFITCNLSREYLVITGRNNFWSAGRESLSFVLMKPDRPLVLAGVQRERWAVWLPELSARSFLHLRYLCVRPHISFQHFCLWIYRLSSSSFCFFIMI